MPMCLQHPAGTECTTYNPHSQVKPPAGSIQCSRPKREKIMDGCVRLAGEERREENEEGGGKEFIYVWTMPAKNSTKADGNATQQLEKTFVPTSTESFNPILKQVPHVQTAVYIEYISDKELGLLLETDPKGMVNISTSIASNVNEGQEKLVAPKQEGLNGNEEKREGKRPENELNGDQEERESKRLIDEREGKRLMDDSELNGDEGKREIKRPEDELNRDEEEREIERPIDEPEQRVSEEESFGVQPSIPTEQRPIQFHQKLLSNQPLLKEQVDWFTVSTIKIGMEKMEDLPATDLVVHTISTYPNAHPYRANDPNYAG
ncbi:hypothetical protein EV426DRAFT_717229 [Tirmania nivea]|nr:hypothetical protein EV426DRAFT_717229 [Tirmania nivea]